MFWFKYFVLEKTSAYLIAANNKDEALKKAKKQCSVFNTTFDRLEETSEPVTAVRFRPK